MKSIIRMSFEASLAFIQTEADFDWGTTHVPVIMVRLRIVLA